MPPQAPPPPQNDAYASEPLPVVLNIYTISYMTMLLPFPVYLLRFSFSIVGVPPQRL